MKETARIRDQMKQAFAGEAWHGPALMEILADIDAATAAAKPLPEVHSIWEIALHLEATQNLLLRRLGGDSPVLSPEQDWPRVPRPTESAWRETIEKLSEGERRLEEAVSEFPDERLDQPLIAGGSSAYNNFHGYVQHNLYHAAQMGLLKRLLQG